MIQELYRFANFFLVILLCVALSSVQSVLLKLPALSWLELDLLLLVIVYLSLHRHFFICFLLILCIGRIAEVNSSAPVGILTTAYLAVFLAIILTKEMVLVATSFSTIILAVAAGVVWKLAFILLAHRYGILGNSWRSALEHSIPFALGLGILSRPVFGMMRKLDHMTYVERDSEAREMTGEEF
jgi:hypothetical protein